MTPQIPGYLLSFELIARALVTIIALSLIWLGAARMPASAKSRYATAGVLSAVFIGWLAVAQYLGAANTYFASTDTAVPTVLFGLLIPLAVAAIALWQSESERYCACRKGRAMKTIIDQIIRSFALAVAPPYIIDQRN
jgi:hypothetical protein